MGRALSEPLRRTRRHPRVCKVDATDRAGLGPEAAAREARYEALGGQMRVGDWLLSAHHRDDQAETLLINLLRGSGPAGLAAMPSLRPFAAGLLVRPLLSVSRADSGRLRVRSEIQVAFGKSLAL